LKGRSHRIRAVFFLHDQGVVAAVFEVDPGPELRANLGRECLLWIGPDAAFRMRYHAYEIGTISTAARLAPMAATDLDVIERLVRDNPRAQILLTPP
jgi:hypothetical protein